MGLVSHVRIQHSDDADLDRFLSRIFLRLFQELNGLQNTLERGEILNQISRISDLVDALKRDSESP